ncbi:MAG: type IX secretion system membrane protein PorP/SprF [Flavobacteriales bacterium]|nr:type IX secretion system membrane protein PorP/SprF [Flavobacteriales bacterium]
MGYSKIKKILLGIVVVFATADAFAQQSPLYTMYMWNQLIINPAYAGSREALTASAVWREQWVGLEGAPSTQVLSIHSPLPNDNIGLGFTVQNDNIGPVNNTGIWGDFAYRMKVTQKSRLALALRGGFAIHQADLRNLQTGDAEQDPAFTNNVENNFLPNFGFGAYYYSDRGYVGVSSPSLIENELNSGNNIVGSDPLDLDNRHFYLLAGYVFNLTADSGTVMFRPSTVVRAVKGAPVSFDIAANFLIKQKLWVGASYRYQDAIAAMVSFNFTQHLQAGYSYDFGTSDLNNYHNGSHEIMLTYDFFKEDVKVRNPRYF